MSIWSVFLRFILACIVAAILQQEFSVKYWSCKSNCSGARIDKLCVHLQDQTFSPYLTERTFLREKLVRIKHRCEFSADMVVQTWTLEHASIYKVNLSKSASGKASWCIKGSRRFCVAIKTAHHNLSRAYRHWIVEGGASNLVTNSCDRDDMSASQHRDKRIFEEEIISLLVTFPRPYLQALLLSGPLLREAWMKLPLFPGLIIDEHKFLIFGLAPELKGRRMSHT